MAPLVGSSVSPGALPHPWPVGCLLCLPFFKMGTWSLAGGQGAGLHPSSLCSTHRTTRLLSPICLRQQQHEKQALDPNLGVEGAILPAFCKATGMA